MFAVVESGSIISMPKGNKGIQIGDIKHPASIFTIWTEAQRNAIGIYTVEIDNTNKKDEEWYINTDITYAFSDGKVKGTYGTATAKPIDDVLFTAQDETDGLGTEGEVKQPGIRQGHIDTINAQAASILQPTDWMVVRAAEGGTAVPSSITTKRAAVRTKANAMCTQIDAASDVDALAALYVYTNTGTEENPVFTRPLGELPTV